MKKAVLMIVVIMMAPVLALAQSHWSVSPAIGFYKASLDVLSDGLNQAEASGATVQKPNGSFHFGGKLHYEKSPRWSWLAEVSIWKDKGAASNLQTVFGTLNFEDRVRLVPIMIGSQYYFSQPGKKNRIYAGATGGIVLVNVKSQVSLVGSNSEVADQSGNDFLAKPFVGLEMANNRKMFFWGELGYVLGKYTIETTSAQKDVSINGLHITGGVKFRL